MARLIKIETTELFLIKLRVIYFTKETLINKKTNDSHKKNC